MKNNEHILIIRGREVALLRVLVNSWQPHLVTAISNCRPGRSNSWPLTPVAICARAHLHNKKKNP